VLFHVPSDPSYGALSGRSRDEQIAGARVEVAPYKKDPADFVLWKPSKEGEPGWDSPWGKGRPGWHIECSAMSEKHLGLPFDIHGGVADLKFPHHENEIAQSCCAHGCDGPTGYVKYWVHNGFLTVEGEKMSKSLGNFLLAHDLIKEHPGDVLRLALLSAHYRQPLDWSDQVLHQMKKLLDKLYKVIDGHDDEKAGEVPEKILNALCDDLNTPQVLAELNALVKEGDVAAIKASGHLIGILQQKSEEWFASDTLENVDEIDALINERTQAKVDKNFARADEIRDELKAQGIEIEDTRDGTKWRKIG